MGRRRSKSVARTNASNRDSTKTTARSSTASRRQTFPGPNRSRSGSARIPMVRRRDKASSAPAVEAEVEQVTVEQPSTVQRPARKKGISMVSRKRSNTGNTAPVELEGNRDATRNSVELVEEYSENTLTEKFAHFYEDLPTSYRSRTKQAVSPSLNGSFPEDAGRWNRHKPHSYRNRKYSADTNESQMRSASPTNPFLDFSRSG